MSAKVDWREYIHSDPKVLAGKPVIRGTRLAVDFILGLFAAGWTTQQVLESYPTLTAQALQAVSAFAALATVIQRYRAELERSGIHCERVLLFGSQATGAAREGSDIDLFVVSPDWARYGERERLEILGVTAARILEPIQARGVTPDEIATHQLSAFWEQVLDEQAIVVA